MERHGIAVAGSILVDKINEISKYPEIGELTKILSLKKALGGCVPNVAIGLKRLMPTLRVSAYGKIGEDEEGEYVKKMLSCEGVDISNLKESSSDNTSFTEVMSVIGGGRTFFTYPGVSKDFGAADIDFDAFSSKILHLGYFLLLDKIDSGDGIEILKEAKRRGISTSIDLVTENSERYKLILPVLPYVDNLIINECEAGRLADIEPTEENLGEIAKKLHALGVKERIIIHMPEISVCYHNGKLTSLPSFMLDAGYIKGTTGAGDAFCSGSLIGIYEGLSDEEILTLGSLAATASLGAADATSGIREISLLREEYKNLTRRG